jgi:hypothetical protein
MEMIATPYSTDGCKNDSGEFSPLCQTIEQAIEMIDLPIIVNSKFWALVGEGDRRWLIFDEEAKRSGDQLRLSYE